MDYNVFELEEIRLQSGATLPNAILAYKTYGQLDADKGNVIVLPTWYPGRHTDLEWLIGEGMALNDLPARGVPLDQIEIIVRSIIESLLRPTNGRSEPAA